MKTIVTHQLPHFDEVCAVWLFKRLAPDFSDAKVVFLANIEKPYNGISSDSDPDVVYVGIGRGRFDEHKGQRTECSATLVWKWIKEMGYAPKDDVEARAIERLMEYAFKEDTGMLRAGERYDFEAPTIIKGLNGSLGSDATMDVGISMVDGIVNILEFREMFKKDWSDRIEFDTIWGKGVGLETDLHSGSDYAYSQGFVILVSRDSEGSAAFRAQADSDVDLTEAYEKLKEVDEGADWYLHHGKRMLICGKKYNPDARLSKLQLKDLIRIISA